MYLPPHKKKSYIEPLQVYEGDTWTSLNSYNSN